MEQTTNLKMPFIMPSQAQKHVTHNEALLALDVVVQLSVLDRHLAAPPALPAEGDRYIVAAAASGAWAGKSGQVAAWQDGVWTFHAPATGWLAWIADEQRVLAHDGVGWTDAFGLGINPAPMVGVNATADATNRLSVKSPAILFDNQGTDQLVKINKATAGDSAALLFQTGYSGRAEIGLAGDDDWHVKVSPDGATWTEALKVSRTDGRVALPAGLALTDQNQAVARRHIRDMLAANRTYYVRADGSDANSGLANTSGGAFLTIQKAINATMSLDLAGFAVTIQVADGTYAGAISVDRPFLGGPVTLAGNVTTPANAVLSLGAYGALKLGGYGTALSIKGFKVQNSAGGGLGQGILVTDGAVLGIAGNMDFGACTRAHLEILSGATVNVVAGYSISGDAPSHWQVSAATLVISGQTITMSGTRAFSSAFASAQNRAGLTIYNLTKSGTATGKYFDVTQNSVANTFGGGATYLFGSIAGTTATGGQYV